jgi:hypothetical protein
MLGKKWTAFSVLIILAFTCFATDDEECFALNSYFNKTAAVIHQTIDEYTARLSSNPGDYYANLAIAILYSALSSPMDSPEAGASGKVVEYASKFQKKEPNNSLGLIYLGLGHSLVSRDSKKPITQLLEVKKAISVFDKAVSLSAGTPRGWYSRYMRANFFMNLPESFHKRPVAEQDLAYFYDLYKKDPSLESYMATGFYYLGEIEKSRGTTGLATEYWTNSVSINTKYDLDSPEAKKAAKELKIFKD